MPLHAFQPAAISVRIANLPVGFSGSLEQVYDDVLFLHLGAPAVFGAQQLPEIGQTPVAAECLPLVGYVADSRDAVCDEGHLRGVAALAGAVFPVQKPFPSQGFQQDEGFAAFERVGKVLRQGGRLYRSLASFVRPPAIPGG